MKNKLKKEIIALIVTIVTIFIGYNYTVVSAAESSNEQEISNEEVSGELLGEGTENKPYIISNKAQLKLINDNLSAYYKLTANIDLEKEKWNPIGDSKNPFTGHFDGNGYKISRFEISDAVDRYFSTGFFGVLDNADVRNVSLDDFSVSGGDRTGSLVGHAIGLKCSIINCKVINGNVEGGACTGGLIGSASKVTIKQCSSANTVKGGSKVGGLVGMLNDNAVVKECYSKSEVNASAYAGGIVGYVDSAILIEDCYALGSVKATGGEVAGIAGSCCNLYSSIKNCYVAAKLSGASSVSGISNKGNVTVTNCYYDAENSKIINTSTLDIDRLTRAMVSKENYKNWDFNSVWKIDDKESYPYLKCMDKPNEVVVSSKSIEGYGTKYSPYIIENKEQLNLMKYSVSSYYKLAKNIDLKGKKWAPVGNSKNPFTGDFEGNGYKISGFEISDAEDRYFSTGFFGVLDNADVRNVSLEKFSVIGGDRTGSLVGHAIGLKCSIINCKVIEGKVKGGACTGGLIGSASKVTIKQCSSANIVEGGFKVGGLVGMLEDNAVVKECYSKSEVNASAYAGGIVGYVDSAILIEDCYALGSVTATGGEVSGIAGGCFNLYSSIKNCYAAAKLSGTQSVSGISNNHNVTVTNCYYDKDVCGLTKDNSDARTTEEMMHSINFKDWDFINVWTISEGNTYPYLREVALPGEKQENKNLVYGKVVNAKKTDAVIANAKINLREGKDNLTGEIVKDFTSKDDGIFNFEELPSGTYTVEVIANGYVTNFVTFNYINGEYNIGNIAMVPVINETNSKVMTVVLTWGKNPVDLDSHFEGNNNHIYYANRSVYLGNKVNDNKSLVAKLDVDDTTSYGPETITVNLDNLTKGKTYNYYVAWYKGTGTWDTSGAKVQVYLDNNIVKEFNVPKDLQGQDGGKWNVFSLNPETYEIIPANN